MNKTILSLLLFSGSQTMVFAQKINYEKLNVLIEFIDSSKADEIIISHQGEIITNWKRTDYSKLQIDHNLSKCQSPYMGTASMVKSWTGLLIGILIDKKYIKNVNDLVCKYLPEWQQGCHNNITIKHLLTMTGGFNRLGARGILSHSDMNKFALTLKPDTLPDIKFSYSNESVQLLGILAERVTKLKGHEIFDKFLIGPLEMDSLLTKGVWKGKQIVSEQWVKESTTPSRLAPYYGYLWWIDKNSKHWNFAATGDLGQMTIVFPDLQIVFIRKQSCDLSQSSLNMSWMGPKFLELIQGIINE